MSHRIVGFGMLFFCLLGLGARLPGQDRKPAKGDVDLNALSLEVDALEIIDSLELTPKQLHDLEEIAKQTAKPLGQRKQPKLSAAHRKALLDYHAALLKKSKDTEEHVVELQAKLIEAAEHDSPELDDIHEISAAAARKATDFLHRLTVTQLALYVGSQQFPDPLTVIEEAIEHSQNHDLSAEDWHLAREEAVHDVARALAGTDLKKYEHVEKAATALLDSAHQVKKGEMSKQRPRLEAQAKELIGNTGPVEQLRNVVENNLAHFLSNPRLPQAVAARKKSLVH